MPCMAPFFCAKTGVMPAKTRRGRGVGKRAGSILGGTVWVSSPAAASMGLKIKAYGGHQIKKRIIEEAFSA